MKIKSLLAAVSMVALTATTANAIEVAETSGAFAAPLALELNLPANPVAGAVTVTISPDGTGFYNQGVQHDVVVTLPAGLTFNGALPNGALTGNGGAVGNIFTGGADGGTSVTFQIAPLSNSTDTFTAMIPVVASACLAEGSGIQATVETAGGFVNNDIDGDNTGSATGAGFGGCASAFSGVVNGTTAAGSDTVVALAAPVYTTIGGDANTGTITYAIDAAVGTDAAGAPMAAADIANVTSTITLAGNPATNGAVLTATNGTLTGGPVTWTLVQTGAQAIAGSQIDIAAGTAVLPNLQPVVTAATAAFVTANGFVASEAGATGNLEAVQRQGQTFGAFDWNAGPAVADPTFSVYRITGLPASSTTDYSVELTNSNANGIYTGSVTANAYGEAQLVSTTLPGVPAGVGRYDFGINLETGVAGIDIDRILFRGGVVSAFNGGANNSATGNTPNTDADDATAE